MEYLIDGPDDAARTFAFAHGAGAGMRTPFMANFARGVASEGIRVVRFEFPYMAGKRRAPDKPAVLMDTWRQVIDDLGAGHLVIGGKSMGGRIASMVADEARVRGVVCVGYPFHPPNRPEKLRTEHLASLKTPTLVIQGTRDAFGTAEEVATYSLSEQIRIEWMAGGDHSLKPGKGSGSTEAQHLAHAVRVAAEFILGL